MSESQNFPNDLAAEQISALHEFWKRKMDEVSEVKRKTPEKKQDDMKLLFSVGLNLESTIQFLFFEKPSFESFLSWATANRSSIQKVQSCEEDVLSAEDLLFWEQNGYVVLKNAVSDEQCIKAENAIWEFLGFDRHKRESWYRTQKDQYGLMVLLSKHPSLDANRQSPRIRKAYEQIYQHTDIWVSIDKVSFNPPETNNYSFMGSPLHWDVSLVPPIPMDLQGLLYLHDVSAEQGAFQCVPGFHRKVDAWLESLPAEIDPREQILKELSPVSVPGSRGDFIIWHQALPHCASPNKATEPRLVQYITWRNAKREIAGVWK